MSGDPRTSRQRSDSSSSSQGEPATSATRTSPPPAQTGASQPGRGRYLRTDPRQSKPGYKLPDKWEELDVATNYVEIKPMEGVFYMYRFDFEPQIESTILRSRVVGKIRHTHFEAGLLDFDGMSDGRSPVKTAKEQFQVELEHPAGETTDEKIVVSVKRVGTVGFGSFEMLRLYNMKMKIFLRECGFFQANRGVFVSNKLSTDIPEHQLRIVRGFQTSAQTHDGGRVLMQMEAVHKVVQDSTVLNLMEKIRQQSDSSSLQQTIRSCLINKLVVPNYSTKCCYKILDVDFATNPNSTFDKRDGTKVSYVDYFRSVYGRTIQNMTQPMLLVEQSSKSSRQQAKESEEGREQKCYMPPEFCSVAGLTEEQANNSRVRMDMIRATQLTPMQRMDNVNAFLKQLHENDAVKRIMATWKFKYGERPIIIKAKVIPNASQKITWHNRDYLPDDNASIDHVLQPRNRETIKVAPQIKKINILIPKTESMGWQNKVRSLLQNAFKNVGLQVDGKSVEEIWLDDDRPFALVQAIKKMNSCDLAIIVMRNQNTEKYNCVKRFLTCDRGYPTQVVTMKLLMDDRKGRGAANKIAIQIAAKLGGEPWHINVPLQDTMICGYDTYHDTSKRGRSFGAFISSSNKTFSRWYSKVDSHERLEELSTHLSDNLKLAVKNWFDTNNEMPGKIIIYRDGVSEGQIEHVFSTELKQARQALKNLPFKTPPRLTFVVVNKRVGARFYVKKGSGNPPSGTVVDAFVTRPERYDFYLISASTRNGTITPTYYNIIYDESGLESSQFQVLTHKLTYAYYNWTGAVRVPAPVQYAHKLAYQTGEHTHEIPNSQLDKLLHFL